MTKFETKIGLEIHVQLKTKSKMFCSCDNNAEGKKPNTLVCPVCLGLPGTLPVANFQAIEWIIKTGLAFNSEISKISKFDRKHYFYPDLPKGYQISQLDKPFCLGGFLEISGKKIRLNRIHLEEDAGKLIHRGTKSLVDLNRAGTPLMEIVTEPDISSPKEAGEFLRKLVKIVRDVAQVSDANMEKGHLRCDANISVNDGKKMSPIVELKNINSFRFIEKALLIEEKLLAEDYPNWPEKRAKKTKGYDSDRNTTYIQREKEESKDYRYFPEPDLPPIDTSVFDLEKLKSELLESEEEKIIRLESLGLSSNNARLIADDKERFKIFSSLATGLKKDDLLTLAKAVVNNYFNFSFSENDFEIINEYVKAIEDLASEKINRKLFSEIVLNIHTEQISYSKAKETLGQDEMAEDEADLLIEDILTKHPDELNRYRSGEKQLLGFFMGQIMAHLKGKGNPKEISSLLRDKLEGK